MNTPKISIVTASFNSIDYIENAIQSVLGQDYPYIEYIVRDGGSTDGTLEILKKYEGKLRWVSEPDKGIYDALNKGFAQASGDVFTWLDSDNCYETHEVISRVADAFRGGKKADIVLTNGMLHYPDHGESVLVDSPVLSFNELLVHGNAFMPESVFYTRELFQRAGALNLSYRLIADYELWLKMWKLNPTIVKLPFVSAVYTVRNEALLRKNPFLAWQETFRIGAYYRRPLTARMRIRAQYVWERVKFPFYKFLMSQPVLYAFYKNSVRRFLKNIY
ncbi:MAG: glycosyltransferase [Patescibacteria group bacterium]|nr:glycosyltransferase [Patescibacteria group bacterium]MDE2438437.1 glycosyltransferase [Patescibacteria group bacterium]